MTTFSEHREKWQQCQRCPLWKTRRHVVLCRGKLPADLLLIGMAPGPAEDVIGYPFVGPAGQVLNSMLRDAGIRDGAYAISNLVGCIPLEKRGGKYEDPKKEHIDACSPRLTEIVEMCRPLGIVLMGQIAQRSGRKAISGARLKTAPQIGNIIHPAAIVHMDDPRQKELSYRKAVAGIRHLVGLLNPMI